jgi:hypothetical protein
MDHGVVARRVPSTRYAQSDGAKIAFQVCGEGPCDADLARRGIQAPGQVPSLSAKAWLDLVHSAYYVPVSAAA